MRETIKAGRRIGKKTGGTIVICMTMFLLSSPLLLEQEAIAGVTSCQNLPVRISGTTPTYYSTLQAAYDAAVDGNIIQSHTATFSENLAFKRTVSITLDGGFDCGYAAHSGKSALLGILRDNSGKLTIGNFAIVSASPDATYVVASTASAGGGISPAGTMSIVQGANQAYAMTPDAGYKIAQVLIDEVSVGTGTTYIFNNVSRSHTIKGDFVGVNAPVGSIVINGGAAYTNTPTVTLTLGATDTGSGMAQMQFSNDNVAWSVPVSYVTTTSWTLLAGDGTKTVFAKFKDNAGNWSASYRDTIIYDTIAPTATITAPSSGLTNKKTPMLTYAVSDGTVAVKVDGLIVAKTSGALLDPLPEGPHTARVESTDGAGNKGFAEVTFTIDTTPPAARVVTQLALGGYHSLALKSDGTLWAWGDNYGQLGDGSAIQKSSPVQIGSDRNWASSAAGYYHSVAVKKDGTLWAWGHNAYGHLGDGTTIQRNSPVQVGQDNRWKAVAAGSLHTLALKSDGTLWGWGFNEYGQLGNGTTIDQQTPAQVGQDNHWAAIAAGSNHSLALKTDGTLWAWGNNENGNLGDGSRVQANSPVQIDTDTRWIAISAGAGHSVALKSDGTLWAWGDNYYGQLGDNTTNNRLSPEQIGGDTSWVAVSAGVGHTIGLKSNGTFWAWGDHQYGQLGLGTADSKLAPTQIETDTKWISIAAGYYQSLAVKSDGTVWAFGRNDYGQIGDRTTIQRNAPVQIGRAEGVTINNGALYTNSVSVTLGLSAIDANGLAEMQFSNDGTTWSAPEAYADTKAWTLGLGNGLNIVYAKIKDNAGNWSAVFSDSIALDTSAPSVVITSPSPGLTNKTTPMLTYTASDGVVAVTVDGSIVHKVSGNNLDVLSSGTHTVRVESIDAANNVNFDEVTFTIDANVPAVTLTSPVAGTATTNRPALNYSVSDGMVVVKLDGIVIQKISGDTLDALSNGSHTVRVEAKDNAENIGFAEVTFVVPDSLVTQPNAPTNLTATVVSTSRIDLSWTDNSSDEKVFVIYKYMGSSYYYINTVGPNVTSYSVANLPPDTSQTYVVAAVNSGHSAYSNSVAAATLVLNAPTNLTATPVSTSRIDLSWTDNSSEETGFVVSEGYWVCWDIHYGGERYCAPGTPGGYYHYYQRGTVGPSVTVYSVTGLAPASGHVYAVYATNGSGISGYSNDVNATTLVLNAPTNLTATPASTSRIDLTWTDNSTEETGFVIIRKYFDDYSGIWRYEQLGTVGPNVTNYSKTGLAPSKTQIYVVVATNSFGISAYSDTATATTLVLNAPTNLTATVVSTSRIDLSWTDNSSEETGFVVSEGAWVCWNITYGYEWYCPPGTPGGYYHYYQIGTVGPNVTVYYARGLAPATGHVYAVYATNGSGISGNSNNADATTLVLNAPTNLTAKASSPTQITLTWADNSSDETGIKIEKKITSSGTYTVMPTTGANVTSFTDPGLSPNIQYFYRIKATNGNGDSPYSAEASATITLRTITATAGAGGTISPAGPVSVADGTNQAFTITPDIANAITGVTVDGVSVVTAGTYTFNNVTANHTITAAFAADTISPTGTIVINNGTFATNNAAVTLTLTASDIGNTVTEMRFSNDNATWSTSEPFAVSKSWTLSSGEGTKTVYVKYKDRAGNWSSAYSSTIIFDTIPPVVTITSPATGNINNNRPLLTYLVSEGTVTVKVDGTAVSKVSGDQVSLLSEGTHTVRVESVDVAGNSGFAAVTFVVDTISPTITMNPVTSPTISHTQVITGSMESNAAVSISISSTATAGLVTYPTPTTWSCSITGLVEGNNVITAKATDSVGNTSTVSNTIMVRSLTFSNVDVSRHTLNALALESVSIFFRIDGQSTVTLKIIPVTGGAPVYTASQTCLTAGAYLFTWDGHDNTGKIVPDGAYLYILEATDGSKTGFYSPPPLPENYIITTGDTVEISELKTDPYMMQISYGQFTRIKYTLSRDANVTLKLTSPSGAVITLFNGQAQLAGPQEATWNGLDPADTTGKKVQITEEGDYMVSVLAKNPVTGTSSTATANVRIGY